MDKLDTKSSTELSNHCDMEEKKNQVDYIDGLQQQVDFLKMKDPAKYQKYQDIGESLMNCKYDDLIAGIDVEGDNMNAQRLLYSVRDYDMEDDLSDEELNLLIRVYGIEWKKKIDGL